MKELKATGLKTDLRKAAPIIKMPKAVGPAKRSKYGNVKIVYDGIPFDSTKEGNRYLELKQREREGAISELCLQTVYDLSINGVHICKYKSDFDYIEANARVVEDSKGFKTREYKIKRALMRAIYNITIRET